MSDNKGILDEDVYKMICEYFDNKGWSYNKHDDSETMNFSVSGEDIPMDFVIRVRKDNQLISLFSPIPVSFKDEKRIDGAIASCVASYGLPDGSFDYNMDDGKIFFRMTASFRGIKISESLLDYMISYSASVVDDYNDKFFAISLGALSLGEFISTDKQ